MARRRSGVVVAIVAMMGTAVPAMQQAATAAPVTYAGSAARLQLARPIEDVAPTPTGRGYWLVAADGGIFSFGDARFHGSTGAMRLNRPIVGMAATRTGRGYWLVASDGGIFSFGDARFYGSTGWMRLNRPIVDMAATRTGRGYWLVASDGGIFSFGDARFYGSAGRLRLTAPIVDMAAPARSNGYWLLASDGGLFAFGGAPYMGSAVGATGAQAAVSIAAAPADGYVIATQWGGIDIAGNGHLRIDPNLMPNSREEAIALEIVNRINRERAARGLPLLARDRFLEGFARRWALRLATTNSFFHQDLSIVLRASNGRLGEAGENLFAGNGSAHDAGSAHIGLMMSPGHRENILLPEHQLIGVGAMCLHDTLWVVEDFGSVAGTPLPTRPVPPLLPFVASDPNGASC